MRFRWLSLVAACAVLAACGEKSEPPPPPQPDAAGYAKSFDENFLASCKGSAIKSGVAEASATALCGCVLSKVDERYPLEKRAGLREAQLQPLAAECAKRPAG